VTADLTPHHCRALAAYARDRLRRGEGAELCADLGIEDPALVATYAVGYLPSDYLPSLPKDMRRALTGNRFGRSLMFPAFDEQGAVVDAVFVLFRNDKPVRRPLRAITTGLLAPRLAGVYEELVITDAFPELVAFSHRGRRDVLWLRDGTDAAHNAARLHAAGVRRAVLTGMWHHGAAIRKALAGAGIAVRTEIAARRPRLVGEPAAPAARRAMDDDTAVVVLDLDDEPAGAGAGTPQPESSLLPARTAAAPKPASAEEEAGAATSRPALLPLRRIQHDTAQDLATFRAGPATVVCEVPRSGDTRLEVALRFGGQVHRDRCDLAVAAQRRRFGTCGQARVGLPAAAIADVLAAVVREVQALADPAPAIEGYRDLRRDLGTEERDAALALLGKEDLLDRAADALGSLGWVGEAIAKRALLLAGISRKSPAPMAATYAPPSWEDGQAPFTALTAFTPPEERLAPADLTATCLARAEPDALAHRLLVVDPAAAVPREVRHQLAALRARGALTITTPQVDRRTGIWRTAVRTQPGPVAVLAPGGSDLVAAPGTFPLAIAGDDSPAHYRALIAAERARWEGGGRAGWAEGAGASPIAAAVATEVVDENLARWHDAQRLLACRPVRIPFAGRIQLAGPAAHLRRMQAQLLGLVAASAVWHQFQRLHDGDAILADERDFHHAAAAVAAGSAVAHAGLSPRAGQLLAALQGFSDLFTMRDLVARLPSWNRPRIRRALDELCRIETVLASPGGRGRRREYQLAERAQPPHPTIRLLEAAEAAQAAAAGDQLVRVGHPGVTISNPDAQAG